MQYVDTISSFLFRHEILRAKLKIRDHYFKTIVSGIYENTGQILSLVHIQLAGFETQNRKNIGTSIAASRCLVGKALYDLLDMGRGLFPENEILSETGMIEALKRELKNYTGNDSMNKIKVKGIPFALSTEEGLVFFLVVIEIVNGVVEAYGVESLEMVVNYSSSKLKISILYSGKPIDLNEKEQITQESLLTTTLGIAERLELIGGEIIVKTKRNNRAKIDISMPYNQSKAA